MRNSIRCMKSEQTLCHVAFGPHHNRPSKFHKVVDQDGPGPWGERAEGEYVRGNINKQDLSSEITIQDIRDKKVR